MNSLFGNNNQSSLFGNPNPLNSKSGGLFNNNEDKKSILEEINSAETFAEKHELIYENALNVTPQSAGKYELYYDWKKIRMV